MRQDIRADAVSRSVSPRQEYVHVSGVKNLDAAQIEMWRIIHRMHDSGTRPCAELLSQLQLLGHARIPAESEPSPFLALHFDRGHPLFPTRGETLYLYAGFYFPRHQRPGTAVTRIVPLRKLLAQRAWGEPGRIEQRLRAYALSHGSSWDWDRDSGNRVSCFARILDALGSAPKLTNFQEIQKDRWYSASRAGHEFESDIEEQDFYQSFGLRLEDVEAHVVLRPGDLLVIDNVNAIHGRIGRRLSGEIEHFLVGMRNAPPATCASLRGWLIEQFDGGIGR